MSNTRVDPNLLAAISQIVAAKYTNESLVPGPVAEEISVIGTALQSVDARALPAVARIVAAMYLNRTLYQGQLRTRLRPLVQQLPSQLRFQWRHPVARAPWLSSVGKP